LTAALLVAFGLLTPQSDAVFAAQTELQGLYDEISAASQQFATADDIDQFHSVFYTPDWVFVDGSGQKETWQQARVRAIQALTAPPMDSMGQPIQKLTLLPDGATVTVNVVTVRTVVDAEGRYGRAGGTHTLTETTPFRDRWVRSGDKWMLKSREQIGKPIVAVDKS